MMMMMILTSTITTHHTLQPQVGAGNNRLMSEKIGIGLELIKHDR